MGVIVESREDWMALYRVHVVWTSLGVVEVETSNRDTARELATQKVLEAPPSSRHVTRVFVRAIEETGDVRSEVKPPELNL
jgi:hypothetical protein